MKKIVLITTLLMFFSTGLFAQTGKGTAKKEKEIHTALKIWADAVVSRDVNELNKVYADDLIVTDYNGGTRGKKEELAALAPSSNMKTVSVVNEDVRIRDYGKAAVVTAITKMHFVINGKDANIALRYTAVFIKLAGHWQITTLQTARIAPPKTN